MAFWEKLRFWKKPQPAIHLQRGVHGEKAAQEFLQKKGLKFLTRNFSARRGELDLIFREGNCLVFVEVKTRSSEGWTRPSRAVNDRKRRAVIRAASEYLSLLDNPQVPYRFDVIEVLLQDEAVREIRHIENSFNSTMLRLKRRR